MSDRSPKRARLPDDVDIVKAVNSCQLYAIFYNLHAARFYEKPYDNRQLGWEHDELWNLILNNSDTRVSL